MKPPQLSIVHCLQRDFFAMKPARLAARRARASIADSELRLFTWLSLSLRNKHKDRWSVGSVPVHQSSHAISHSIEAKADPRVYCTAKVRSLHGNSRRDVESGQPTFSSQSAHLDINKISAVRNTKRAPAIINTFYPSGGSHQRIKHYARTAHPQYEHIRKFRHEVRNPRCKRRIRLYVRIAIASAPEFGGSNTARCPYVRTVRVTSALGLRGRAQRPLWRRQFSQLYDRSWPLW